METTTIKKTVCPLFILFRRESCLRPTLPMEEIKNIREKMVLLCSEIRTALFIILALSISVCSIIYMTDKTPFRYPYKSIFLYKDTFQLAAPVRPFQRKSPSEVVRNVAFIKTHKTASTTVSRIVERFGYLNNLSLVLNKNIPKSGHFYYASLDETIASRYLLPPRGVKHTNYSDFRYNISSAHILYNRTIFETFMDTRTKYITILRNPVSQFVSAFGYFAFKEVVGIENETVALELFMESPVYYRNKYEKSNALWKYSRNNQMFDLGLRHEFHDNVKLVKRKIKEIDKEFDFILIGDYLDESLIILKKIFGWSFEDIMYASQNRQKAKKKSMAKDLYRKIRQWNSVDAMLYDHFNETLWRKIAEYGNNFERDLEHFRNLNQQLIDKCTSGEATKTHLRGFKQVKFILAKDASDICQLVIDTKKTLFKRIWDAQNVL